MSELGTLVDPGVRIPADITPPDRHHHGDAARRTAAGARSCRRYCDMLRGSVLVAHNAPFDAGFLKAACERLDRPGPAPRSCAPPGSPVPCSRTPSAPA
ncbi:hypothetical protein [Pseudonocardia sp. ICBG601]|uniref:hypothetical protein n=1 Tax=Pseudonocardia sp. ICBG601 TaxID=2846759 RepID=UPI0035AB7E3F